MSLLKPRQENRALSYSDVWGSGGDWTSYKDGAAQRLGAVYACNRLISSKVAGCPIRVYRARPDGTHELVPTPAQFTRPFRQETPSEWKWRAVSSLVARGNTYGLPLYDDGAASKGIAWLDPALVTVNDAMYPDIAPSYYYRARELRNDEIIHMALAVSPGSVTGISPIAQFRRTFEAGLAAEKYGSDWFETGGQPSGILETEQFISDAEAETLSNRWKQKRANGGIAVLGQGAKYQAVQVSAEEAQFIETQRFSVEQVARIFGVPPEMIGGSAGDSLTYANREQRAIDFVTFTLDPYITLLEEHLTRLVPDPLFVTLDTTKLLAGDYLARVTARAIAIASHQLTPDEARKPEGFSPLTPEQQKQLQAVPLTISPTGKPKAAAGTSAEPGAAA